MNRRSVATTLALCFLPLFGWWATGLFDLDEGFYAAVVAEMNRRGEWITPFYNGSRWFEKPILLYWLAKPCLAIFGEMVGPRLPSVLAAMGTYAVVLWWGRRRLGEGSGHAAALVLATSLLFLASGRMMLTDPVLVLCLTVSLLAFWESLVGDARWRWLAGGILGVAVLAKGPVAGLLFLPIAATVWFRYPSLRPNWRKGWAPGVALFCLAVALWYLPAYLANGQTFVQKFLIEQNIGRFTGGDRAHTLDNPASRLLYVPIFLLGMMPWSFWIVSAWRNAPTPGSDQSSGTGVSPHTFLKAWILTVFVFFSISGAKLPHYILPMLVPAALLIGDALSRRPKGAPWTSLAAAAAIWLFLTNGVIGWWSVPAPKVPFPERPSVSLIGGEVVRYGLIGTWYRMSGQAEAHALVRELKSSKGRVAFYQLSRRQRSLGTGKLKIQETSLPSVFLYLDSTADDIETDGELRASSAVWVLTRWDRISNEKARDFGLTPVATKALQDRYRVFRRG